MSRTQSWLLGTVLLMLLAGLVWVALNLFEQRVVDEEIGLHGIARRNPHLAAQRFLEQSGIPTRDIDVLIDLPEQDTVLVLLAPRQTFGEQRTQRILAWAFAGGHLVVTPRHEQPRFRADNDYPSDEEEPEGIGDDSILEAVSVEAEWVGNRTKADDYYARTEFFNARENATQAGRMNESFKLITYQEENPKRFTDRSGRTRMLHLPYGDGAITVLAGAQFCDNHNIDYADNAALLREVISQVKEPEAVWFSRNDTYPSFGSLLAKHAPEALIAGLLLLATWLFRRLQRFGPMLPPPNLKRRSLREHLDAAGIFLWRHNQSRALLAPLRTDVERRLQLRLPGTAAKSHDEQHRALAERAEIPLTRVTQALTASMAKNRHSFTQAVEDLVTLRNSL